jgi:hypothetical protein
MISPSSYTIWALQFDSNIKWSVMTTPSLSMAKLRTKSTYLHIYIYFVTYISDFRREFGLANRFIGYSLVVTTNTYKTFKITIITSQSQSYVTTDGQSARLSWNKAPIWGLRPDIYYCQTTAGLLMRGALSHGRTGLTFTIAARPRQCSHFRVWDPWDSWPFFTVSDSRLPFRRLLRLAGLRWRYSIPPPHGSTVGVQVKVTLRLTVSQSIRLGVKPHLGLITRYLLHFDSYGLVFLGRPLWR